jgi:cytoskeleton protein RodZ
MTSVISVSEASWIEASDLQGRQVWARTLTPGEVVDLESSNGLRLTIGNAAGTQVRWRGQVIDLSSATRDNVARIELK